MKALIIAAALALSACAPLAALGGVASLPVPSKLADRTKLDEQAALAVELAYKTARTLAELAVDAGAVKPGTPLARRIAVADVQAYAAVVAVRSAYDAGNADAYDAAATQAREAIDAYRRAVKG